VKEVGHPALQQRKHHHRHLLSIPLLEMAHIFDIFAKLNLWFLDVGIGITPADLNINRRVTPYRRLEIVQRFPAVVPI